MKSFYVYIYRDHQNIPFYVGKGHGDRAYTHLTGNSVNPGMDRKIKKLAQMGITPSIEIIDALDEGHAFLLESCLIEIFGRRDNKTGTLFNLTDGGEGSTGLVWSPARKKELGVRMKAVHSGKPKSDKHKAELAKSLTGKKRTLLTCPHCGLVGGSNNLKKHHFDQCRYFLKEKWVKKSISLPLRTEEQRRDYSERLLGNKLSSGLIWINDGIVEKRIKPDEFDSSTMIKGRIRRMR